MESRLGVKLLQRTTRTVKLTEAGSQYLEFCQQALDQLRQGEDLLSEIQQEVSGHLRIAVPQNFADLVLPKILLPFMEQYPRVTIDVQQGKQKGDLVKEGYDLAIRASFSDVEDSSLIYRKIYQSQRIFVASPEYIEAYGHPASIEQLKSLPYIASYAGDSTDQSFNQIYSGDKWHSLNPRLSVNSMLAVKEAILAGLGFAIMPVGMAQQLIEEDRLVRIAEQVLLTDSVIYLVYPSRRGQPAKLRKFIEVMVQWGEKMMQDKQR